MPSTAVVQPAVINRAAKRLRMAEAFSNGRARIALRIFTRLRCHPSWAEGRCLQPSVRNSRRVVRRSRHGEGALVPLPDRDFDVTEVAVPWMLWRDAGHDVVFATETGATPACDPLLLTGVVFGKLGARPDAIAAYRAMEPAARDRDLVARPRRGRLRRAVPRGRSRAGHAAVSRQR